MNNKKLLKEAFKNKVLAGIIKEGFEPQQFVYDNNGQKLDVTFVFYPGKMSDQENPSEEPEVDILSITDENGIEMDDISEDILGSIKELAADSISYDEPGFSEEEEEEGLGENNIPEVPEIQEFRFKVKHDNGVKKLKTKASSLEAAKQIIMNAEGCPEGALELVSEMKKTYGQEGKAEKLKHQKHLRPAGKKIANAATRKAGKEISKNAEKDIDLMSENSIASSEIKKGDILMYTGDFKELKGKELEAMSSEQTFEDWGEYDKYSVQADVRSFWTGVLAKDLSTGKTWKIKISNVEKVSEGDPNSEDNKSFNLEKTEIDKISKALIDNDFFEEGTPIVSGEYFNSFTRGKLKHNQDIRQFIGKGTENNLWDEKIGEKYWNKFY